MNAFNVRFPVALAFLSLFAIATFGTAAVTTNELAERDLVAKIKAVDKLFDQLSHQDISRVGKLALGIDPKKWKHAESDHFILHYQVSDVKNRLIREAEYYYWKIQNDLKTTLDQVDHKSHIFVFEDDEHWRMFQGQTGITRIAGVTIRDEFFCYYPKKKDKDFSATVAHEMTHLVINRFFTEPLPLWLNEGFAEYQSHNAFQSLYGKRLGPIKGGGVDPGKIDFLEMTTWTSYPDSNDINRAFYIKSQLAVNLLIEKGGTERFLQFLYAMMDNSNFKQAFEKHYTDVFKDIPKFLKELARKEKKL